MVSLSDCGKRFLYVTSQNGWLNKSSERRIGSAKANGQWWRWETKQFRFVLMKGVKCMLRHQLNSVAPIWAGTVLLGPKIVTPAHTVRKLEDIDLRVPRPPFALKSFVFMPHHVNYSSKEYVAVMILWTYLYDFFFSCRPSTRRYKGAVHLIQTAAVKVAVMKTRQKAAAQAKYVVPLII